MFSGQFCDNFNVVLPRLYRELGIMFFVYAYTVIALNSILKLKKCMHSKILYKKITYFHDC